MSTPPNVRPATLADVDAIAEMKAALWPDDTRDVYAAETRRILAGHPVSTLPLTLFVAEQEGRCVGFAEVGLRSHADGCDPRVPVGYLEGWYVAPDARRTGAGRALADAAARWSAAQGAVEFASDTWADNDDSIEAHRALGFERVDVCVNFRRALPRTLEVVAGGQCDWPRTRALRLSALLQAPNEFAMTLDDEEAQPEAFWRQRALRALSTRIATINGRDAGLAVVLLGATPDDPPTLNGTWVEPWARGQGVGDALLRAALRDAAALDHEQITLVVNRDNPYAIALYERHGFRTVDERNAERPGVVELVMRAELA